MPLASGAAEEVAQKGNKSSEIVVGLARIRASEQSLKQAVYATRKVATALLESRDPPHAIFEPASESTMYEQELQFKLDAAEHRATCLEFARITVWRLRYGMKIWAPFARQRRRPFWCPPLTSILKL